MAEPCVSYTTSKRRYIVYRGSALSRLEYVDTVPAFDIAHAARMVVKKHHDWRSDGMEWSVVVIPAEAPVSVRVMFEPQVVGA